MIENYVSVIILLSSLVFLIAVMCCIMGSCKKYPHLSLYPPDSIFRSVSERTPVIRIEDFLMDDSDSLASSIQNSPTVSPTSFYTSKSPRIDPQYIAISKGIIAKL